MLSGTCSGGVAVDPAFGPVVYRKLRPWAFYLSEIIIRAVTFVVSKPQASPVRGTPGWPLLPFGQFTFRWPGADGAEGWRLKVRDMLVIMGTPKHPTFHPSVACGDSSPPGEP